MCKTGYTILSKKIVPGCWESATIARPDAAATRDLAVRVEHSNVFTLNAVYLFT